MEETSDPLQGTKVDYWRLLAENTPLALIILLCMNINSVRLAVRSSNVLYSCVFSCHNIRYVQSTMYV